MKMDSIPKDQQLFSVMSTKSAHEQMDPQSHALNQGELSVQGFGNPPAYLATIKHPVIHPKSPEKLATIPKRIKDIII
jgi:hypothetical protein